MEGAVTTNPNRCPNCWSSLPPACVDFCPHCGRSLALEASKRRWPGKSEEVAAPAYPLDQSDGPPAASAPLSTPAPGAVAVLERDPAEFPGQPLPPEFFAALPERTRRAPRKLNLRLLVVVTVVGGGAIFSALGQRADRSAAVDSPARHLVAGACAEYRDFTTRMDRNSDDVDAFGDALAWFQNNGDRFTEAARLDPQLQPAADFVVWFNGMIGSGFETILEVPQGEIDAREAPLSQACYTGPGRA
ncbi:MAG: hypothetical protein M3357_16035 [Actinomycetota bacterium]|nr:hypothetical protein [Actinomycetota bacterium]